MKKVLFVCALASVISCSSDNNTLVTEENGNDNIALTTTSVSFDNLFSNYLNSDSYIQLQAKVTEFSHLLKYTGDVSLITTNEDMFEWIEQNLSTTDFTSIEEAHSKWNVIEDLGEIDMVQNASFYSQISLNKSRFAELWLEHSVEHISTNNQPCKNDLIGCNTDAATQYADGMAGAWDALTSGTIDDKTANTLMNQSRQVYAINLTLCQEAYEACLLR